MCVVSQMVKLAGLNEPLLAEPSQPARTVHRPNDGRGDRDISQNFAAASRLAQIVRWSAHWLGLVLAPAVSAIGGISARFGLRVDAGLELCKLLRDQRVIAVALLQRLQLFGDSSALDVDLLFDCTHAHRVGWIWKLAEKMVAPCTALQECRRSRRATGSGAVYAASRHPATMDTTARLEARLRSVARLPTA